MKKEQIYVPIANKKEAKRAKAVLEAMGIPIAIDCFNISREDYPCILGFDSESFEAILVRKEHTNVSKRTKTALKQLIELLVSESQQTIEPEKIAVRVDNEKEFNALMKYYDILGWKCASGAKSLAIKYSLSNRYIYYHDKFLLISTPLSSEEEGYKIIPFSEFAKEHGIRVPLLVSEDGVELFKGDLFHEARAEDCIKDKWMYCHNDEWFIEEDSYVVTKPEISKAFSTKQSALDWIEAQKPKEIVISPNSTYPLIVTKNKASIDVSKKPTPDGNIDITKEELTQVLKAMEELNS